MRPIIERVIKPKLVLATCITTSTVARRSHHNQQCVVRIGLCMKNLIGELGILCSYSSN